MTVGQRLTELRKVERLSQKDLSCILNCTQQCLSSYENDKIQPSIQVFDVLVKRFNVNMHWLLFGEGEMFLNNKEFVEVTKKMPMSKNQSQYELINPKYGVPIEYDSLKNDTWNIPIVAEIAAGSPIEGIEEDSMGFIQVLKKLIPDPYNYVGFKVTGNSMMPEVLHDDCVLIKKDLDGLNLDGKIVAVRTSDGITLKRLEINHKENCTYLYPINKDYSRITLFDDSIIIGSLALIVRLIKPE